jgi:hypothetical protein
MESQNHLRDAVDREYISEAKRQEFDALAETALKEVTGLMEYLQSPEGAATRETSGGAEDCVETRAQNIVRVAGGSTSPCEPRTLNVEPEP